MIRSMNSKLKQECRCKGKCLSKENEGILSESQCDCTHLECFEWGWDKSLADTTAVINENGRNILFNPGFSVGTVAVRGDVPFTLGYHHYFEIEMVTEVYGTAMMIGVGTVKTDLKRFSHNFVCLIGYDEESWGLSYSGTLYHKGLGAPYTKFTQGSVIGVHLDMWHGTLEYYLNRKPLGKAFTGLKDKVLYPMVSSTAARSGMNLTYCSSFAPTLQLQTLLSLGRQTFWPENVSIFKCHDLPPGLKSWVKNNFWWVVCNAEEKVDKEDILNKPKSVENKEQPKLNQGLRRRKVCDDEEGESSSGILTGDEHGATSQEEGSQSEIGPSTDTTTVHENKRLRLLSFTRSH